VCKHYNVCLINIFGIHTQMHKLYRSRKCCPWLVLKAIINVTLINILVIKTFMLNQFALHNYLGIRKLNSMLYDSKMYCLIEYNVRLYNTIKWIFLYLFVYSFIYYLVLNGIKFNVIKLFRMYSLRLRNV